MFVSPATRADPRPPSATGPGPGPRAAEVSLSLLTERVRPVSTSRSHLLPVLPPLRKLFPDGGLRRGSTVVVTGQRDGIGGTSMALALLAAASGAGSWCALVGVDDLGAVAAHDLGVDLDRITIVPHPGAAWAEVVAALVQGVDLVMLRPPFRPRPAMVRKLTARTGTHRSVLVVVPGRSGWPVTPDLHLDVTDAEWDGAGTGYLTGRRITLTAAARRGAAPPRRYHLWLPSPAGAVAGAVSPDSRVGPR